MSNTTSNLISQLLQTQLIDTTEAEQLAEKHSPWWLQILMAFAAWIASLFIISSFLGPIFAFSDVDAIRGTVAFALLVCALYLAGCQHDFLQQMSVAFALAAQGLAVYLISEQGSQTFDVARYSCIAISCMLWFSPLNQLHRRISMAIAIACAVSLLEHASVLAALAVFSQAACIVLWCQRKRWASHRLAAHLSTLLPLLTLTIICLGFLLQSIPDTDYSNWLQGNLLHARAAASVGFAAMFIVVAVWLSHNATLPSRLTIALFSLALVCLLFYAPALMVSTTLLLCCFYATAVGWVLLMLVFQVLALGYYYYSLQLTLLEKSGLLTLATILLFIGWALVERYKRRQP